jgi:hypothetical protein
MRRSTVLSLPVQLVFPATIEGCGTMAEHSSHHPKVEGSCPATYNGNERESIKISTTVK